jgi:hypothetical protein
MQSFIITLWELTIILNMQKTFYAALIATVAFAANDLPTVNEADFSEHWFENKVDHFNY